MHRSNTYTIIFSVIISIVCSIFVAGAAVLLKEKQSENRLLDQQKTLLKLTQLMPEGANWTSAQVEKAFQDSIETRFINLKSGTFNDSIKPETYNLEQILKDPSQSHDVPANRASIFKVPNDVRIFIVKQEGKAVSYIFPIHGKGLWSTMYGYLALAPDGNEIQGIIYYQHGETPGLGGEIENPRWRALWKDRKVYGTKGEVEIQVIKGSAGPAASDPYSVDGLSGATLTGRGVTNMLHFWFGKEAYEPFIQWLQKNREQA